MKYQLVELGENGSLSIYEVTDDLSMERLIWTTKYGIFHYNWRNYIQPINTTNSSAKWISKEEAFIIML